MNKQEFLDDLAGRLSALPKNEIDKSIAYYNEMIDDRIEDGMTEAAAVNALGDIRIVEKNILSDLSIPTLMKAKVNESKNKVPSKGVWLTLVILGFPLWFPLLIAFGAVLFALYVSAWSIIISLYAVVVALGAACVGGIVGGGARIIVTSLPVGICIIGAALFCGALCLFLHKPIMKLINLLIRLTKSGIRKIKSLIISRKGEAR